MLRLVVEILQHVVLIVYHTCTELWSFGQLRYLYISVQKWFFSYTSLQYSICNGIMIHVNTQEYLLIALLILNQGIDMRFNRSIANILQKTL